MLDVWKVRQTKTKQKTFVLKMKVCKIITRIYFLFHFLLSSTIHLNAPHCVADAADATDAVASRTLLCITVPHITMKPKGSPASGHRTPTLDRLL